MQQLNAAQAERIRALTIAAESRGATCEDNEALIEEITVLRNENDDLTQRANDLAF